MATHERMYEKTPSGVAYSEIFYLDEKHNVVDSSIATRCVIREYTKDGHLIRETWASPKTTINKNKTQKQFFYSCSIF